MPKLNEYISIGFCSGYGDGDYRVSAAVGKMSRKQIDELIVTMFHAQRCMWDMWCCEQPVEHAASTAPQIPDNTDEVEG